MSGGGRHREQAGGRGEGEAAQAAVGGTQVSGFIQGKIYVKVDMLHSLLIMAILFIVHLNLSKIYGWLMYDITGFSSLSQVFRKSHSSFSVSIYLIIYSS